MGEPMDRSKRVFGTLTTFEKAFPTVESATIASYEDGDGIFAFEGKRQNTFGPARPFASGLIRCSNPYCRRGGYEVDLSLSEMVRGKLTEKEFSDHCSGDEGSPQGRKIGKRCYNVLHYRLTIKYKPESPQTTAPK
jgi:hypothetical protein